MQDLGFGDQGLGVLIEETQGSSRAALRCVGSRCDGTEAKTCRG